MGGLYIHIPFCRQKCRYCNFFSTADTRTIARTTTALRAELALRAPLWADRDIRTVYFGGGTPSLLPTEDIDTLLNEIRRHFSLPPDAEITLEANPDDITPEKARHWRASGINRLSVGIQSFDDPTLAFLGRRHSGLQAQRAIETLRKEGFENLTLDLIYGIPQRDDDTLQRDVETALGLGAKHLSAYALTVEPHTALSVLIGKGRLPAPDDDQASRQYLLTVDLLENAGMQRYELSNFSFPGYRSRHNSAYWTGAPYLGIGPSAHSFDGRRERRWNLPSSQKYLLGAETGHIPFESELLSEQDLRNERVMTALRTREGLSLDAFAREFGHAEQEKLLLAARKHLDSGSAEISGGALRVTRTGWFFTDGISADLFETD